MKKVVMALALCLMASAARASPVAYVPGSGPPNVIDGSRDATWSEPPDLNGLIGSSEQILQLGLETELANDFVPSGSVAGATWWGGFYNNSTPCASGITTPGFNLRFYEDGGCVPGTILADLSITNFTEEAVGCQAGTYPMFKWGAGAGVNTIPGSLYWFGAQMKDHAFPPQAGRLASAGVVGCDTVFRSAYFAYPDWTPAIDVFGVAFDCSQEFTEGQYIPWGACCWPNGSCTFTSGPGCDYGDFQGDGTSCEPNPCEPYTAGACCFGDLCIPLTHERCDANGGEYHGDNTPCDPNPCDDNVPTKSTSWGAIKGSYR